MAYPAETETPASATTDDGALTYGQLEEPNPEYQAELWQDCRALYAGGPKLLRDDELMKRLFPRHMAESEEVYKHRKRLAHYFPYAGWIIDRLVAGLAQDPIQLNGADAGKDETTLPDWYREWVEDVSAPGGDRVSLRKLAADALREALITQTAWVLVDLPDAAGANFASRADQERAGMLDPYAVILPAELVKDWEVGDDGALLWALVCDQRKPRRSLADKRDTIVKTYTEWTRAGWRRWEIAYEDSDKPQEGQRVALVGQGDHGFGRVPLVRLRLPDGLWAMGKLESLAREHFNKRNAQAHAERRSLNAVLYEFQGPEEPFGHEVSAAQQDPQRGTNQVRGVGYVQLRGKDDKAMFIGPDVAPFKEARESSQELMREMHRVIPVMAASVDMSSGAMRRSGESKREDRTDTEIVLRELGGHVRDAVREIVELVKVARGEAVELRVTGAEKFEHDAVGEAITEAVELLNGVPQKSATFLRLYLYRLYRMAAGDATEEELAEIRAELDRVLTPESLEMGGSISLPPSPGEADEGSDNRAA